MSAKVRAAVAELERGHQEVMELQEYWSLADSLMAKRDALQATVDIMDEIMTDERYLFPEDPRTTEVMRKLREEVLGKKVDKIDDLLD